MHGRQELIECALVETSNPTTSISTKKANENLKKGNEVKKEEKKTTKIESGEIPKALNDFTKHKEVEERKKMMRGTTAENGSWERVEDEDDDGEEKSSGDSPEEISTENKRISAETTSSFGCKNKLAVDTIDEYQAAEQTPEVRMILL